MTFLNSTNFGEEPKKKRILNKKRKKKDKKTFSKSRLWIKNVVGLKFLVIGIIYFF